jgi:hypothetical protein
MVAVPAAKLYTRGEFGDFSGAEKLKPVALPKDLCKEIQHARRVIVTFDIAEGNDTTKRYARRVMVDQLLFRIVNFVMLHRWESQLNHMV